MTPETICSVDVAMATYNHAPYIAQAIESVLAQKTTFPVRLVIGDDASTDGTREIVEDYQRRFPSQIKTILNDERRGIETPDRLGYAVLRHCCAPYVALLDGDDYWIDQRKLQKQVELLEDNPDCVMCGHFVFVHGHANPPRVACMPQIWPKTRSTLEDLLDGYLLPTCSIVLKKAHLDVDALSALTKELSIGDVPLAVLVAQHGWIGFVHEFMGCYRLHENNWWAWRPESNRKQEIIRMDRALQRRLPANFFDRLEATILRMERKLVLSRVREGDMRKARGDAWHYAEHWRRLRQRGVPGVPGVKEAIATVLRAYLPFLFRLRQASKAFAAELGR